MTKTARLEKELRMKIVDSYKMTDIQHFQGVLMFTDRQFDALQRTTKLTENGSFLKEWNGKLFQRTVT